MTQAVAPPKFIDPRKTLFRHFIAAGLIVIAILLVVIAVKFQTEIFVLAKPLSRSQERYQRIWFNNNDKLIGARVQDSQLEIHRLGRNGSPEQKWDLPIGSPTHWAVSVDLSAEDRSYVAWIDGTTLYTQPLSGSRDFTEPLPSGKRPLALTVTSDGFTAVVFDDGAMALWNPVAGGHLEIQRISGLERVDQAEALGDYVAVSSPAKTPTVALYRCREGKWSLVETAPAPEPPFSLAIPAPALMATLASGQLRTGTKSRNSPGRVVSAASYKGVILATGDFENIRAFSDHEAGQPADDYDISDVPRGSILAAGKEHLAYSNAQGTGVLSLNFGERLTTEGIFSMSLATLATVRASLLVFGTFLLGLLGELVRLLFRKKRTPKASAMIPQQLPDPPPQLVGLLAEGKGVLWAGAGLSAQSGLPLRHAFATGLFQTAKIEKWIEAGVCEKLQRRLSQGEVEAAMDALLESASRSKFASYADATLPHFVTASPSHEMVAKLPFTAAFTTNYDDLLSMLDVPWKATRFTVRAENAEQENLEHAINIPFLLKWYGNLTQYRTVLMTHQQLAAAATESGAARLFQQVLQSRSLLFVGASLEGIKADLEALNVPKTPSGKHYVVTGVSDPAWKSVATQLSEMYGIEALVCSEDNIGSELPKFLEKLVEVVTEQHASVPMIADA